MNKASKQIFLGTLVVVVGFIAYHLGAASIQSMYPNNADYTQYLNFYLWPVAGMAFASFIFSSFLMQRKIWIPLLISLLLFNALILLLGFRFSFLERTEEFLLYFLAVQVGITVVVVIASAFLGYLFRAAGQTIKERLLTMLLSTGLGAGIYFLTSLLYFEIHHLWMLSAAMVVTMIYLSSKSNTTLKAES